jgi:hypothetical protein
VHHTELYKVIAEAGFHFGGINPAAALYTRLKHDREKRFVRDPTSSGWLINHERPKTTVNL